MSETAPEPLPSTSLSVAAPSAVRHGRPLQGVALIAGVALGIGALAGALLWVARPHDARDARTAAVRGVAALVSAEAGHGRSCSKAVPYLAGDGSTERAVCRAIIDVDHGAHLRGLKAGAVHLAQERGTVHLTGTLHDGTGAHTFISTVPVTSVDGDWRLDWDGAPPVAATS